MRHKNKILALLAIVAVIAGTYKLAISYKIAETLESSFGLSDVQLYINDISFKGITLKDVRIGSGEMPLHIPEIKVTYSLYQLLEARVDTIVIKRPRLDAHLVGDKLSIRGLESWFENAPGVQKTTVLPADVFSQSGLRFNNLTVEDARIRMLGYGIDATMYFGITAATATRPQIDFKSQAFTGKYNGQSFSVPDIDAGIILNEADAMWEGDWGTKGESVRAISADIPAFKIKGNIRAEPALITSDMSMTSEQTPVRIKAQMKITPKQSVLLMKDASLPWAGGVISVRDIALPIRDDRILNTMVSVSRLSLNDILGMVTGNRASATGTLSGKLPVGITNDGGIIFYPGELRADKAGTIHVEPEAIPADNLQIDVLRQVLKDFRYDTLSMKIESGTGNTVDVHLSLDGKNPEAYKGRPVKLNVHLTGDLLNIVQQTVLPVTNPDTLLKKEAR